MLIGFTGKMRVGKSTASAHLVEKGFVKINFKDALVEEIKKNFIPLLSEIIEAEYEMTTHNLTIDDLFVKKPPLMRALMQCYGTEVRRGDNSDYWVKQWVNKVHSTIYSPEQNFVCDDVRFLNEAKAIRVMGGVIIRLTRPDVAETAAHSSESEMDRIVADHTIDVAAGDFDKLYAMIDSIVL